ncbi:MAG: NADH-quinone oxidoreductase subunit L, partial [Bacteroidota bacterium]
LTALLTAIYMTRAYLLTFEGKPRWPAAMDVHPHESPWTMTVPLIVLAFFAAIGGVFGLAPVVAELFGWYSWIHHWLGLEYGGPVAEATFSYKPKHSTEWLLLGVGSLIALGGIAIAWFGFRFGARGLDADRKLFKTMGWLYTPASKKWGWDELYNATFVRAVVDGARKVFAPFDKNVVDGAVTGLAKTVRGAAGTLRGIQTGGVQTYAAAVVLGVVLVVALLMFV